MQDLSKDTIDLDAYFQRIGDSGDRTASLPTLKAIHARHTTAIAFENLSSLLKQPVLLDTLFLQQKLVDAERGGYCFEQNGLFYSVLIALGFRVARLAARVLWGAPESVVTPRSHMLLMVYIDDTPYHPKSLFVSSLVVSKLAKSGRYSLRNNQFTVHSLNGATEHRMLTIPKELRSVLVHEFQLTLPNHSEIENVLSRIAKLEGQEKKRVCSVSKT